MVCSSCGRNNRCETKSILLEGDCLEDRAAMADYYYHEDENTGTGNVM